MNTKKISAPIKSNDHMRSKRSMYRTQGTETLNHRAKFSYYFSGCSSSNSGVGFLFLWGFLCFGILFGCFLVVFFFLTKKTPPHTEAKPDGQMLLLLMLLIPLQDYLLNETARTSTSIACHRYRFSSPVCLYQVQFSFRIWLVSLQCVLVTSTLRLLLS